MVNSVKSKINQKAFAEICPNKKETFSIKFRAHGLILRNGQVNEENVSKARD